MNKTADRVKKYYFDIFDDFCDYWRDVSEEIVDWSPSGTDEIIVRNENDMTWLYNYLDKTLRKIYKKSDADLSEEEWRYNFSVKLKRKMRAELMSNIELSNRTGISTIMISKYINCKSSPSAYNLQKIADALGTTISALVDFE